MSWRSSGRILAVLLLPVAVAACTTLSEKDRALLDTASQNASAAKAEADKALTLAQQALDASKAAQGTADQSAQTALAAQKAAQAAALDARSANEKADRMFQKSLRK